MCLRAIKYHSAALESVNKRLGHPYHGKTDGIVASVLGFASHSVHYLQETKDGTNYELT